MVLLCVGMAISAALLIAWRSHLTFFIDDWDLLLHRRGLSADVLLDSHARHLIVGPAILWKAIEATFGLDSQIPFAVAATTTFMASVALLFVYLRRRVGDWLALAGVAPVLFMGTAYEDLLNVFQICYFGSMAFGLAALLTFERASRRRDALTCLLLLLSLAFAEIAFAFAAACAVTVAIQRGPWRRLWVVAIPILIYIIWYIGWGRQEPSSLSFDHVANSPTYVLDGFASSVASLFGFGTPILLGGNGGLDWGRPLLVALVALAVWGLLKFRASARLLIPLAAGLTFWFLTAANAALGRPPDASRYQYVGAVFLLMIVAEYVAAWRPAWRPGWRVVVPALAVSAAATIGNLSTLHDAYSSYRIATQTVRGGLAGVEIAQDSIDPGFVLTPENSNFEYFGYLQAGLYLSAEHKFGSPAYSQAELASASEFGRVAADKVMASALGVSFRPLSRLPRPGGVSPRLVSPAGAAAGRAPPGCITVRPVGGSPPVVSLPPGGVSLRATGAVRAQLWLRRFASASFPIYVATLRGAGRLDIPRDRSTRPWQLRLDATGPVTVCAT
jgi:hypothetical protein